MRPPRLKPWMLVVLALGLVGLIAAAVILSSEDVDLFGTAANQQEDEPAPPPAEEQAPPPPPAEEQAPPPPAEEQAPPPPPAEEQAPPPPPAEEQAPPPPPAEEQAPPPPPAEEQAPPPPAEEQAPPPPAEEQAPPPSEVESEVAADEDQGSDPEVAEASGGQQDGEEQEADIGEGDDDDDTDSDEGDTDIDEGTDDENEDSDADNDDAEDEDTDEDDTDGDEDEDTNEDDTDSDEDEDAEDEADETDPCEDLVLSESDDAAGSTLEDDPCAEVAAAEEEEEEEVVTAAFGVNIDGETGLVTFNDQSSGDIAAWAWDFGDGNSSSDSSPTHTYGGLGTYTVSLTVTGVNGASSTTTAEVTINQTEEEETEPPVASFNVSVIGEGVVNFNDTSSGMIAAWAWDFGDGNVSTSSSPSHTYAAAGTYTVTLTVTDDLGRSSTATGSVTINPIVALECGFSAQADELTVSFSNTSSGADSYQWTFGDGNGSTSASPSHTYEEAGTYSITLTCSNATDSIVASGSVTLEKTIIPTVPSFSVTPSEGDAPLMVTVSDSSEGEITAWEWSFGDDTFASGPGPHSHTYLTPGTYTITLTVTSEEGSFSTSRDVIALDSGEVVEAIFQIQRQGGVVLPQVVNFVNQSTGTIVSYEWDFDGDGVTDSSSRDASFTYEAVGSYAVTLRVSGADGESSTATAIVDIVEGNPAPIAKFVASATSAEAPATITFTDQSENIISSWVWTLPDGSTVNGQSAQFTFETPGEYAVSLQVTGPGGSDSTSQTIIITHPAMTFACDFSASLTDGRAPLVVDFSSNITVENGTVTSITWDFGDGTTATGTSAQHTYEPEAATTYDISMQATLTADDDITVETCTVTGTLSVIPADGVVASFNTSESSGALPFEVGVSDTSEGPVVSWEWDWGDGTTSSGQNPGTHTYTAVGSYTITLTVTNEAGESSSATRTVEVLNDVSAGLACNAGDGATDTAVTFSDQSTGPVTTWLWDFGNGVTSSAQNPPAQAYEIEGTYTVTLTVQSENGEPATASCNVRISNDINARFRGQPGRTWPGRQFTLRDDSTGPVTSWEWDFGDGTTASGSGNQRHSYAEVGTYTITLRVGNAAGDFDTFSRNVTVTHEVRANFDRTPRNIELGESFTPRNRSFGDITSWQWDWGDGTSSSGRNPGSHFYTALGEYNVTLTVANDEGSTDSFSRTVRVGNNVDARFNVPGNAVVGSGVAVNDTSTGAVTRWLWDWGDGTTSSGQNPGAHVYEAVGTYTITLTVDSEFGAPVSTTRQVTIVPQLNPSVSVSPDRSTAPRSITFTGSASGEVTSWQWEFSNGWRASGQSVTLTFSEPGTITGTLRVTGPAGTATASGEVLLIERGTIRAAFAPSRWSGIGPMTVDFADLSVGDDITAWQWDFGNGQTSTSPSPTTTYTEPGTYTVRLTVQGIAGSATATNTITVYQASAAQPDVAIQSTSEFGFSFDVADAQIVLVDYGDGNSGTATSHNYTRPGTYEITIVYLTSTGETIAIRRVITVTEEGITDETDEFFPEEPSQTGGSSSDPVAASAEDASQPANAAETTDIEATEIANELAESDTGVVATVPAIDSALLTPPVEFVGTPACTTVCVPWRVYHTNQTGDWEIFRLDDRNEFINLSQGEGADDMAPSRSPDGEWIAFTSNRDGNWEIYIAPIDGDADRIQRVTFNNEAVDTDPAWGPNDYVVYESTRDGNWELYMLDMRTGIETRLTDHPGSDLNPFWSPDGSRLLFQSNREGDIWQIYELDIASLEIARLSDGSGSDLDPQFANNGEQIVFRSYRLGENSIIYLMNADGTDLRPISNVSGDATNAVWSPDDAYVAYQSDVDGDLDIYVYELATALTRQLTDNTIADYAPTWRCNTTEITFTSEIMDNPDIFEVEALPMMEPPLLVEDTAEQLTDDPAQDIYPQNSPSEENASREGELPDTANDLGQQTAYMLPELATTPPDITLERGEDWPTDFASCSP